MCNFCNGSGESENDWRVGAALQKPRVRAASPELVWPHLTLSVRTNSPMYNGTIAQCTTCNVWPHLIPLCNAHHAICKAQWIPLYNVHCHYMILYCTLFIAQLAMYTLGCMHYKLGIAKCKPMWPHPNACAQCKTVKNTTVISCKIDPPSLSYVRPL